MKKLTHLVVASAAAFSLGAIAADENKQKQEPQAQSGQMQPQAQAGEQKQHDAELVKQVQQKLSASGHEVQSDGVMGPRTQAALKEYQQSKGLQASGELDQQTMAALGVSADPSASVGSTAEKPSGAAAGASAPAEEKQTKEKSKY